MLNAAVSTTKRSGSGIPVAKAKPLIGLAPQMMTDPLTTLDGVVAKYGDVVYLPGVDSYLIADADLLADILTFNEENFSKSQKVMDKISPAIGRGLSTLIGPEWRRQRRMANPAFSRKSVNTFGPIIRAATEGMLRDWDKRPSPVIDVSREMKRLTLRIVIQCLFSTDIKDKIDEIFHFLDELQEYSIYKLWSPVKVPEWIPTARVRRYQEAKRGMDEIIYGVINERRRTGNEGKTDLLAAYMEARDEETGEGMPDIQLRHELMNLFLAGHETTANGIAFALNLLAKNPECYDRAAAEVDSVLNGRPPEVEELETIPYVRRVFDESLRLYPSSWGMSRNVLEEYRWNDFVFPAGAKLIIAQWCVHRSSKLWDDPLKFNPDRFIPENVTKRHRYAYLPFGAGKRMCVGVHLARVEGHMILAMVVQKLRTYLTEKSDFKLKARLFMTADPGVFLRIEPRHP